MKRFNENKMGMHILLIDDDPLILEQQSFALINAGYENLDTCDGTDILQRMNAPDIDLIILDHHIPGINVLEALRRLRRYQDDGTHVPVIMVSADPTIRHQAYVSGVNDFIEKPIDIHEFVLKADAMLELRMLHATLTHQNQNLVSNLKTRNQQLQNAMQELEALHTASLRMVGRLLEIRDMKTSGHTQRVVEMSLKFATYIDLDEATMDFLEMGALLHDVGKLAIPDAILNKPGKLDDSEWGTMRAHTTSGYDMLIALNFVPETALTVVRHHHERWDGAGYPDGLAGEDIPLLARMFSLVDVYDALTSPRVYKKAWTIQRTLEEIKSQAGQQFDPELANQFCAMQATTIKDTIPKA